MKNILIIGWYGTETIGDRAILSSLLMHIKMIYPRCKITIGSIYPFHTTITLLEDKSFYAKYCGFELDEIKTFRIVDVRNRKELKNEIIKSDIIIMGGGPFDDIAPMYMIDYAFLQAKINQKKTMIYGCGCNPIKNKNIKKAIISILNHSDEIIFRDNNTVKIIKNFYEIKEDYEISIDPAVFSAKRFRDSFIKNGNKQERLITFNLRRFPEIYSTNKNVKSIDINRKSFEILDNILKKIDKNFYRIIGISMHYFQVGGDDRSIMEEYKKNSVLPNIAIQIKPLSLEETMELYAQSKICIGTRFHSVVLQTILNGNNYVLNYTAPKIGKIPGFIEQIGGKEFYKNRYIELQGEDYNNIVLSEKEFHVNEEKIIYYENIFKEAMERLNNV